MQCPLEVVVETYFHGYAVPVVEKGFVDMIFYFEIQRIIQLAEKTPVLARVSVMISLVLLSMNNEGN